MLRSARLLILALSLGGLATGCQSADPESAEYWVGQLATAQRKEAIRRLGEMKDKPGAIEALVKAYDEGRNKYEIVAALSQAGDQKAVPVLLKALEDTSEAKAGQLAATTLLDWKAGEGHSDVYLKVAANKSAPKELRYGALQLLAEYPTAAAEPALLQILQGDPDLQPIAFNGLAGEALGKLKSEKAIDGLIYCMWLDDHLGRNEVAKCRLALNRIGKAKVVPKAIETLERKNRLVEARATKFKFHVGGLVEAKSAELLGDMASPDAVEPLIAAMTKEEEPPASVMQDPKKANAFVMGSVQRAISTANALAVIGDERAVEPLVKLAAAKDKALEYKLSAVQQLAFLGNPKAIDPLWKLFDDEPSQHDPVSQGFRVQLALAIANLMDGSDAKAMEKLDKQVDGIVAKIDGWIAEAQEKMKTEKGTARQQIALDVKGYTDWKNNYGEAKRKLVALAECKDDPACWGKHLAGDDIATKMLAGYRLAQMQDKRKEAMAQLITQVGEPDLAVRNVILFGLDRVGDASLIPQLEKARAADAEKAAKDKRFQGAVYTLDLMIAKLSHTKG
ncbi:MAG: HEAT repeat domain-containing protein [Myxococcales bacterium]|nr:HEAT repeat domain-containing protein [Myxococcales bacterium]MCB9524440.1 HEAT repeat domain-containing protein [Myxococcales bacterium]